MAKNKNKNTNPSVPNAPNDATTEAPETQEQTSAPEPVAQSDRIDARAAALKPAVAGNGAHANPAFLHFPTDVYGLTSELKTAMLSAASRVNGQPDKLALVKETLKVLIGHLHARYAVDNALVVAMHEKAVEEAARRREAEQPATLEKDAE